MKRIVTVSNTVIASLFVVVSAFNCFAGESATKDEVIAKVQEAISMAQKSGMDEILKEINNKEGKFVWKDSYVFALEADTAKVIAHPVSPNLIGKNLLHVKDKNGVMLFAEFAKIGTSATGKGWVDYVWPKPGEKLPSPKHSYIEKAPGENISFGAGYHD